MQTARPLTIEIDMSGGKSRNGRLELNDLPELASLTKPPKSWAQLCPKFVG